MSEELKPCPFCGGPGYLCQIPSASGGDRYIWIAKCSTDDGCGVEFLGCSRKVDAIKEWNARDDKAVIDDLLARVRARTDYLMSVDRNDTSWNNLYRTAQKEVYAEMFGKEGE